MFDDSILFEHLAIGIFDAGALAGKITADRWRAMRVRFFNWDPTRVAAMDESDLVEMRKNVDLIRDGRKHRALIRNARMFVQVTKVHGSFGAWFESLTAKYDTATVVATLVACFDCVGEKTATSFLADAAAYIQRVKAPCSSVGAGPEGDLRTSCLSDDRVSR